MSSDHVGLVGSEPLYEFAGVIVNVPHRRKLPVGLEGDQCRCDARLVVQKLGEVLDVKKVPPKPTQTFGSSALEMRLAALRVSPTIP